MAGSEHIEVTLRDVEVEVDYCDLNEHDLVEFVVNEYLSTLLKTLAYKDKMVDTDDARAAVMHLRTHLGKIQDHLFEIAGRMGELGAALGMEDDE